MILVSIRRFSNFPLELLLLIIYYDAFVGFTHLLPPNKLFQIFMPFFRLPKIVPKHFLTKFKSKIAH